MKSRMVGLFAVALIALMVAGLAYAHWTETLVLEGTVKTGKLDLTWSCKCWDNDDELKNVGDVDCNIEDDTLTITVSNAYPCYEVSGTIDIENIGTVPAVLKKVEYTLPPYVTLEDLGGYKYNLYYGPPWGFANELMATLSLKFRGDPLTQIERVAYIDFTIHFTNPGLPEDWSGTFTITLSFENWSPPPT